MGSNGSDDGVGDCDVVGRVLIRFFSAGALDVVIRLGWKDDIGQLHHGDTLIV